MKLSSLKGLGLLGLLATMPLTASAEASVDLGDGVTGHCQNYCVVTYTTTGHSFVHDGAGGYVRYTFEP